jgi:hypothetical protein
MRKENDAYGIDMKRFCLDHEQELSQVLANHAVTPEVLQRHLERLRWLQHERLVHLIVLVLTAFTELFTVDLTLLHPVTHPGAAVMMLVLAVLLGFYFRHYFFLENHTQHWYRLTMELEQALDREED